jgi:hypothetical protein
MIWKSGFQGEYKKNLLRAKEEEREFTQKVISTSGCLGATKLVNHVDIMLNTNAQDLLLPEIHQNSENWLKRTLVPP